MFVFRLSWTECLDFEQLIIQQILKGINEIWRISAEDNCCHGSQDHTTTFSCNSVSLFTLFTTSPHSSRSAMKTWEVIFIIIIFLRKQKIAFVAQGLSNLASVIGSSLLFLKKRGVNRQSQHTNRRTGEQDSTVNGRVLIMLVKEPIRLVRRCRLLNNTVHTPAGTCQSCSH